MKTFSSFDETSGKLLRILGLPQIEPPPAVVGEVIFEGDYREHWYNSGTQLVVPLSAMTPVASPTQIILGQTFDVTGLPLDSVVTADYDTDYPLPDGIINATFATVGKYEFLVRHPHYFQEKWTVEVSP